MEVLVANVDDIKFDVELAVEQQIGTPPMQFPGMDSKFIIFIRVFFSLIFGIFFYFFQNQLQVLAHFF